MTPSANTPLLPTDAEAINPGPTTFVQSAIWCDVGGTVTVRTAGANTEVTFSVPDQSIVPVMCIRLVSAAGGATGFKRVF